MFSKAPIDEFVGFSQKNYFDETNFYLQNQRLLITYPSHIPKDFLESFFKVNMGAKELIIAHENGDANSVTPYEHTHVYVDFGRRFQTRNCRFFDIGTLHPHIKKILSSQQIANTKKYLCKEDPDNADLLKSLVKEDSFDPELIWKCESIQDVLSRYCKKPSDAPGLIALFNYKKKIPKREIYLEHAWQYQLAGYLKDTPVPRKILWIFDPVGNTGKTRLALHLWDSCPLSYYIVDKLGGGRDAATIIHSALETGWDGWCFICDLPRDAENKSIYEPLESLSNGFTTATKYKGSTQIWESGHVVVFANFLPNIHKMSHDRWDVREIVNEVVPAALIPETSEGQPRTDTPGGQAQTLPKPNLTLRKLGLGEVHHRWSILGSREDREEGINSGISLSGPNGHV